MGGLASRGGDQQAGERHLRPRGGRGDAAAAAGGPGARPRGGQAAGAGGAARGGGTAGAAAAGGPGGGRAVGAGGTHVVPGSRAGVGGWAGGGTHHRAQCPPEREAGLLQGPSEKRRLRPATNAPPAWGELLQQIGKNRAVPIGSQ